MKKVTIIIFLVVFTAWTKAQNQNSCTGDEKQIAMDNANGRELESCTKAMRMGCKLTARYTNGESEEYNSPDGQLCCEMVGVLPTGRCRDGKCAREETYF